MTRCPAARNSGWRWRWPLSAIRAVFVLDEPTAGLDPQMRREVQDHIRAMKDAGRAVLLATHDMDEAERLCDRLAVIAGGRIVATGTPRDLIAGSQGARLEDVILQLTART